MIPVRLMLGGLATFGLLVASAATAADRKIAFSRDGHLKAWIKPVPGAPGASGNPASALWLTDLRTGRSYEAFRAKASGDPRTSPTSIANPDFSLDGGYVYVDADAYVTSPAVYQISVRSGRARHVVDGSLYGVVRMGPWRGYLLVQQHRYRRSGSGSYDPYVVYRPDGRQMTIIPGSEGDDPDRALARWMRQKKWEIS